LQRILRTLVALVALLVATTVLVACGGDGGSDSGGGGGETASTDTDVNTLLEKTFTGSKDVKSGKIDLSVNADVSGGSSGVSGPVSLKLSGPFESQGAKKLPKFAFTVEASGQGQNIKAGATSTGEKGFVNFNGTDYVVSDEVFNQFKQGYEQADGSSGDQQSLASLGLDPKKWLKDPENAGEAKVGDTDVIKITGGLDVPKFLDDLNTALSKAGSLGGSSANLPSEITPEQKKQIEDALKDVSVEIDTGKEDTILRRMKIDPTAEDAGQKATVTFDLQLLDLNEGQDFSEPSDPKPFEELLGQFGGLGALGGSSSGSGSSGSGSGSSSSGASAEKLQEYSKCLEDAGQDVDKAQECASLLTP